ncbi:uncharacterized protein G2W53_026747 [Senna tora]|uniref:Uncharacterized protein n=1 Tax=Senna tora TaxID=362788 RepID=A0A834TFM7_9FABA|nr:uncharacterized protein G2W53_026747 [Senna tora]
MCSKEQDRCARQAYEAQKCTSVVLTEACWPIGHLSTKQ